MRMPKTLPTIDVNNVLEYMLEKLKVAKGVAIAPSLKCLQGCCVTKENYNASHITTKPWFFSINIMYTLLI
jgi:aspartate carbamoyltransferase regulatory subunit